MKRIICRAACFGILFSFAGSATAQVKSIPFGDMEHWLVRQVDESGIIGGKTKFVYEVAKGDTLKNNVPFVQNLKTSPWGTSSILAVVKGITKSSTTVFPEYHQGHGLAARMETRIERVKVMGLINISVLATGTMFLGQINEPVRDTKNPMAKLIMGVEFREKPKSLIYDYYFQQGQNGGQRIKEPGFGRTVEVEGINCGEVCMMLQKRWEDAEGNVYAKRVGTVWERYSKSTNGWRNAAEVPVHYGDITKTDYYRPFMALQDGGEGTWHCMNSKGKVVPIVEVGWGEPDDVPTHIILRFSSGHGGAYVGCPGAMMHID
ncbi:MAG: PCMD domain-containing protein, partial [Candidatus Cryptobacteroides sp.]|nr:PCMD domain-containing protein [Bacteroidales bacterium]MDY5496197.1 PCMD domain-containing protein [Candidatus Cryptobacteroides sp.]